MTHEDWRCELCKQETDTLYEWWVKAVTVNEFNRETADSHLRQLRRTCKQCYGALVDSVGYIKEPRSVR